MRNILKQEEIPYTLEQLYLLRMVRDCKATLVKQDLAEMFGKDKSYILRMVDLLEKDQLIRRIVDSSDRRRNILEVTYMGNQLVNQIQEFEIQVSERLLRDISNEEMDVFYEVISKIRSNTINI